MTRSAAAAAARPGRGAARPGRASSRVRRAPWSARRNGRPGPSSATRARSSISSLGAASGVLGEHRIVAVGHRVVHGGTRFSSPVLVDAANAGRARGARSAGAAAPAAQPGGDQGRGADGAGAAAGRLLRYRVSPRRSRRWRRPSPCRAATPRRACGATAFTGCPTSTSPRVLPTIDRRAADGRTVVAHLGNGASMCALERGTERRHHHELHGAGRPRDGHPLRRDRSRRAALPDGAARHGRRALERLLYEESGLARRLGRLQRHARAARAAPTPRAAEARGSVRLPHRPRARLARGGARAGSTPWYSPVASARTPLRSARASAATRAGSGWSSTRRPTHEGGPRISRAGSRVSAWVIPTNEELMIALHTRRVLAGAGC